MENIVITDVKMRLNGVNSEAKTVKAEVKACTGYDGRRVWAKTIEKIHHPADPQGLLRYDAKGNFLGYAVREAYDKQEEMWVDELYDEERNKWVTSEEYSDYRIYLRLKARFEA